MNVRPATRGGAPPPTAAPGARPPTASRMQGSVGVSVLPTGMRPPTASRRLGTAAAGAAPGIPTLLNTTVQVEARPVTQQGLRGMTTKGPARQIADKSYYISELRTKISEIGTEIASMRQEAAKLQRDSSTYSVLERKYEERVNQVRQLEGQLADFNLALDKVRTNTDVSEIEQQFDRLRESNDNERKKIDEIFLKRQQHDKEAKEMEDEVERIHQRAEQRLQALGEASRDEYSGLQAENVRLQNEVNEKEMQVAHLDNKIQQLQLELKKEQYQNIHKSHRLQKQLVTLREERQHLEEEASAALSPEEMRERLMAKVKEDNAMIASMERKIQQYGDLLENYQTQIGEKKEQIKEFQKNSEASKKYELLYERDKKMQEFIERFNETKAEELATKTRLQQSIVGLMQHISKGIQMEQNLPDANKFDEMKGELGFKMQQMQNAESTLAHLQKELEKRQQELDKINNLDSKISIELNALNQRIEQMQVELVSFQKIDELKNAASEARKNLMMEKQRTQNKKDALLQRSEAIHNRLQKQQQELKDNEIMKRLELLENKIKEYAKNIFGLNEFIVTRERESDYETILGQVNQITSQINQLLSQSLS
eukprot:TRINITY_DN12580_c0_g6_i2.p1 TRINITY_DN12580_c0_g6~~TRINITY_DN12580_c0_g6_i2.p1  ORF type:complete len:600 (-),score=185.03 TRINITY_DN12580_c0_g6_i2:75-1874(-)